MRQAVAKFLGTVVAVTGVLFALSALARVPEADALAQTGTVEVSCFAGCCGDCGRMGGMCCSAPIPPFPPFPTDPYPGYPIQ